MRLHVVPRIYERQRGNKNRHLEFQTVFSRDMRQPMEDFLMENNQANKERAASGTFPDCMYGEDRTR